MPSKARTSTCILAILAGTVAGLCFICPLSNTLLVRPLLANFDSRYVSSNVSPIPFNRELWTAGKARHRVGMAHQLINRKLLLGKTRDELIELLGPPDIDKPGPDGMRWLLGYYAKGLFDETLWLELNIDDQGKASDGGVGADWYDPRRQ